ncbi:DEAD/DEAH box helicase family protein, partial [Rhodovulum adriaticum]
MNEVVETLHHHGQHLSSQHHDALQSVIQTMTDMAEGAAERRVYVSSLDPGMGKTTSLIIFLRQLMGSQDHGDVAVLVCLSRKAEIERIVQDAGLEEVDFAVLTSDDEVNALSSTPPGEARVLFTTQQMLLSRLRGGRFEACSTFHYQGLPREVRVWDETMEPGQVVMLSSDDIGGLLGFFRRVSADFADKVDGLMDRLRRADIGSLFRFPKLDPEVLQRAAAMLGNEWRTAHVEALAQLSGQQVRVCPGWGSQRVAVLARAILPEDLAPVLVLDASARVRETYKLWAETRGGVVFLPSATKDYSPLTIHVARKGAGKSSWGQNGPVLAKTVAEMRGCRPDERCLIVHHKADKHLDVPGLISTALGPDASASTSFLHWGMHQATNEYADVPVLILAGTFNLPPSQYMGLAHASLGLPMDKALPDGVEKRVALGEHAHAIVQAVGRGV